MFSSCKFHQRNILINKIGSVLKYMNCLVSILEISSDDEIYLSALFIRFKVELQNPS